MVLQKKTSAVHNEMLGRQIPHPASTKFDDYFATPAAKRVKRHQSTDSSRSRNLSDDDEGSEYISPFREKGLEVADSEDEGEDEAPPASQTDLESSLPPIKTDKEAIQEYESARAAEQAAFGDLQERLDQRSWSRGKSSIYVDAFNLALRTVLDDEAHLFNEAEAEVFAQWKLLSYEAQYLYTPITPLNIPFLYKS